MHCRAPRVRGWRWERQQEACQLPHPMLAGIHLVRRVYRLPQAPHTLAAFNSSARCSRRAVYCRWYWYSVSPKEACMHVTGAADVDGAGLTSPGAACAVASPGADVGTVVAQMLGQSWCRCWDSPGADVHHRQSGQHTEDGLGAEHEASAQAGCSVCGTGQYAIAILLPGLAGDFRVECRLLLIRKLGE